MMSELIAYLKTTFDGLGWLSNLFGIVLPLVAIPGMLYGLYRYLLPWVTGTSTFEKLTGSLIKPKWKGKESIAGIAKVAIVDDSPTDFPVTQLQKAGYSVKTYKQVDLKDIGRLAEYDVLFLDIHGIVKDDIEEGGLKLLPKLRAANSRQKICAVSSKKFDPTATAFFKQADDVQGKPVNAQKCKDVIDVLALEKLEPAQLSRQLDDGIKHLGVRTRRALIKQIREFSISKSPISDAPTKLCAIGKLDPALSSVLTDYVRVLRKCN